MIKKILLFIVLTASISNAATTITSTVVRNEIGSGLCQVSNGFPVPEGLVTEQMILDGVVKVTVSGTEVNSNVTALRGRHIDGSIRSILIQFQYSLTYDTSVTAQVIVDDGARVSPDPAYIMPTYEMVENNNIILPTSTAYLVSTNLVMRNLLPTSQGSVSEERQYTALADDRFDWFVDGHQYHSNASYEHISGILALWCRFGETKFQKEAVSQMLNYWLAYSTPGPNVTPDECNADAVANPDGREPDKTSCGLPSEPLSARILSFAQMYLMTGYRDFWGIVSYYVQAEQNSINSQVEALTETILYGIYDAPRFNYKESYGALLGAAQIDATIAVTGQYYVGGTFNLVDRFSWIVDGILDSAWNIEWIPFDTGSGTVPVTGSTITQGGVSADLLGVYPMGKHDPKRFEGKNMPASGYLMIENRTGGSFTLGVLSGVSVSATGVEESDYRDGFIGARPNSPRYPNSIYVSEGDITGTTLTVVTLAPGNNNQIEPGENINAFGVVEGTYIVQQLSGTTGGVGTYEVSESQNVTISGGFLSVKTYIPSFQLTFPANFLVDYYLYVERDSRIPAAVKANCDTFLMQIRLLEATDTYYGWGDETWGYATYGKPYPLLNPVPTAAEEIADPYELPEYARLIAFVIKTSGDATINGKLYSEWYEIAIDTANNTPSLLLWYWKLFGQFYGWSQDAPWMMAQPTLIDYGPEIMREPTYWDAIPDETPDFARVGGGSGGGSVGTGPGKFQLGGGASGTLSIAQ